MYSICAKPFQVLEKSENHTAVIPPILGYAKPGTATGKLLYVNYGRKEDFDALNNIPGFTDCSGYIAIMRYGKIYRGNKASYSFETHLFSLSHYLIVTGEAKNWALA